jgi:hypothetical protein
MRPPGPPRVDPGVKFRGRLQIFVAQELPDNFVSSWVRVEMDFRGDVPKLVRSDLDTQLSERAPLDRYPNGPQCSSHAGAGDKQKLWTSPNYSRRDLISKRKEPL